MAFSPFSTNHVPPFLGSVGMQMRGGEAKNSISSSFFFSPQQTEKQRGERSGCGSCFLGGVLESAGESGTFWIKCLNVNRLYPFIVC